MKLERYSIREDIIGFPGVTAGTKILFDYLEEKGGEQFLLDQYDHTVDYAFNEYLKTLSFMNGDENIVSLEDFRVDVPVNDQADNIFRNVKRKLYPSEAIRKKKDYSAHCSLAYVVRAGEKIISTTRVKLGKLLVLVGSRHCNMYDMTPEELKMHKYDPREPMGYFIIQGKPKFMYSYDNTSYNKLITGTITNKSKVLLGNFTRILYEFPSGITEMLKISYEPLIDDGKTVEKKASSKQIHHTINTFYCALPYSSTEVISNFKRKNKGNKFMDNYEVEKPEKKVNLIFVFHLLLEAMKKERDPDYNLEKITPEYVVAYIVKKIKPFIMGTPEEVNRSIRIFSDRSALYPGKDRELELLFLRNKININNENREKVRIQKKKILTTIVMNVVPTSHYPGEMKSKDKINTLLLVLGRLLSTVSGVVPCDDFNAYKNKILKSHVRFFLHYWITGWREEIAKFKSSNKNSVMDIAIITRIGTNVVNYITSKFSAKSHNTGKGKELTIRSFTFADPLGRRYELLTTDTPTSRDDTNLKVRVLSADATPFFDRYDNVDSRGAGQIRSMDIICTISIGYNYDMRDIIEKMRKNKWIRKSSSNGGVHLTVNGYYMGTCDAVKVAGKLRSMRRSGQLRELSVVRSNIYLHVRTDRGRPMAPFLTVDDGMLVMHRKNVVTPKEIETGGILNKLFESGSVEFLDPYELAEEADLCHDYEFFIMNENDKLDLREELKYEKDSHKRKSIEKDLASRASYTHCMFKRYAEGGNLVARLPQVDKHLSERVTGQVKKELQAIGVPNMFAEDSIFSKSSKGLYYPEHNITMTEMEFAPKSMPVYGLNLIVAIMSGNGNNLDDGVIMRKGLADYGGWRVTVNIKFALDVKSGVTLLRPSGERYAHLDVNGLPKVGSVIKRGDIIVAGIEKIKDETNIHEEVYNETKSSMVVKSVSRHSVTNSAQDKIIIHGYSTYIGRLGNKVVKGMGSQKFVACSIVPDVDMPWIQETGEKVDIIISPISIASRGSIPWLVELLTGLFGSREGQMWNFSTGRDLDLQKLYMDLQRRGLSRVGYRTLVSGKTGYGYLGMRAGVNTFGESNSTIPRCNIMTGSSLMQINIHMAAEKQLARSGGKIDSVTGLPKKGGGIGGGAMAAPEQFEFAVTTSNAKEFTAIASSDIQCTIACGRCGNVDLDTNMETGETSCPVCSENYGDTILKVKYSSNRRYIDVILSMLNLKERMIFDPQMSAFGISLDEEDRIKEIRRQMEKDYTEKEEKLLPDEDNESLQLIERGKNVSKRKKQRVISENLPQVKEEKQEGLVRQGTISRGGRGRGRGRGRGVPRPERKDYE